jgi:hypothetical protein
MSNVSFKNPYILYIYLLLFIYLLLLLKKRIKSTNRHLIDNQGEKRLTC